MRLRDKVAVVTGASQGLGQHLAIELAKEGAQVVLAARTKERLDDVAASITASGGRAVVVATDLCEEESCRELIEVTRKQVGPVDILILNAGSATYGRLDELLTLAPLREAVQVNLFGAVMPTFYALGDLIERKGLIAYVTSGAGHLPMAGYLGYTTSKHAMNGFFEALRLELRPHGVDVLTINPGDMYSDDGAGRTVVGPDGHQYKVDLSVYRRHDIPRRSASHVARRCIDAIVQRRRDVDESPPVQKIGSKLRIFAPQFVDRRIAQKALTMRSAFDAIADDQHRRQHPEVRPDCPWCLRTPTPLG
ncbi:SDR family NAD(P)-dependent oxidoreductase [Mycobacterium vicinigordonae]|uniref:SDR family NAD(P)-dependent oxidoreductase n=1 Tax=Mycobacterium vicinigordonae TaxID=1719132 RepID=A0A7D6DV10_9MYCO|nr:SDR family NAD(P)-dependent oxidoreductase [Mycobacterium vicinigordonae]QLL05328.1 SDR family NAD(P)-dependent oxidoreductase [Mycobacterium vicinigordonae]